MDWIYTVFFKAIIHSDHIHTCTEVSYVCCHSCPGQVNGGNTGGVLLVAMTLEANHTGPFHHQTTFTLSFTRECGFSVLSSDTMTD